MDREKVSTGQFVAQFDWQEVAPQMAVVEAIETAAGREHHELDVLYEYVDPDALEILFHGGAEPHDIELRFTFDQFQVTVRGDGSVFVESSDKKGNTYR